MEMTYTETLRVVHCWCGIALAIPDNLRRWAEQAKDRSIYCPNGHKFVFTDTFEEKLERERRRHQATKDLLRAEERSHSATRGQLTKTKKRVGNGVCPCCHRTFQQLSRHMKNKHPDYVKES